MLRKKNGFYGFESALHVFPLMPNATDGLQAWNSDSLWRHEYQDLTKGLLFFAEDLFQDQFCISAEGVQRFKTETGEKVILADTIEMWAELILSDYSYQTGWKTAHEWQAVNGPLPPGQRLLPKTPFFLGGSYSLDNLWIGNPIEGLRFKADVALQTRGLPEGAPVRLRIGKKPQNR
ncbi:MAG: SMI1/KNR4 family protein [Terriglobales bacterium]